MSATPHVLSLATLALTSALLLAPLPAGASAAGSAGAASPTTSSAARGSAVGVLRPVAARAASTVADSVGVGVHMSYNDTPYGNVPAVLDALHELGVTHVRDGLNPNDPPEYAAMSQLAAGGIRFDLISGRPEDVAGDDPQTYVDTIVDQLPAGSVEAVEGPNEYDVSGRPDWVAELRAYQRSLYTAVHASPALRGVPVVAPSLAFRSAYRTLGPLGGAADVANSHDYTGGRAPSFKIENALSTVRRVSGTYNTFVTEAGYHNGINSDSGHLPVPENVSGVYEPRLLLDNLEHGVRRVYDYELIDEFVDPDHTNAEANFGLLRHDLSRKPAFRSLRNLLALNADPGPAFTPTDLGYRVEGDVDDVHQLLTQRRDGTWLLMLWRDASIFDPVTQQPTPVAPADVRVDLPGVMQVSLYHPSRGADPAQSATTSSMPVQLDGQVTVLQLSSAPGATDHIVRGPRPGAPLRLHAVVHGGRVHVMWRGASDVTRYRLRAGRQLVWPAGVRHDRHLVLHVPPHGTRTVRVALSARNLYGWGAPRVLRLRVRR